MITCWLCSRAAAAIGLPAGGHGEEYYRLSMNNSIRLQTVDSPRGLILDRHGTKLAENRPSFDVNFTPRRWRSRARAHRTLAHLQSPAEDLLAKVKHSRGLAALNRCF